jgi:hypothetical protein
LVKLGEYYSIQYYVAGKLRRVTTGTMSLQRARENLRS